MDDFDRRFHAVFGALRDDLLRGDFAALDEHQSKIAALGRDLETGAHRPLGLAELRAEAERSRDVLAAAAGGVRAALRRLGEAGAPTAVYAPDGRRLALGQPHSTRGGRA